VAAADSGRGPDSVRARGNSLSLEFKTDAGRIVLGGGGIVPDLIVRQDTFTTVEREFAKAIGSNFAVYKDILTSYALELKNTGTVKSPNFSVTPAMRTVVYDRLAAKGVTMSRATFDGGVPTVDRQLGYMIARYVFGRSAEFRRIAADDEQVQKALGLLAKASTPEALISLGDRPVVPARK
jgi:carboxyl-terminal processing protease